MTWTRTSSAGPTMTSWATVRSGRYPADDKEELTPLEMPSVPSVRQPKALKTYRVTWIEVEADTPLSATRRSPFLPDAAGHDGFPRSACAPLSVRDLQSRST